MRPLLLGFLLLLTLPATASAAELRFTVETAGGVRFGTPHEMEGNLGENGLPLAGQPVEIQARPYPYTGDFRTIATVITEDNGGFGLRRKFNRNVELRAFAPVQFAVSPEQRAYVFPRPRSVFKALSQNRLRITQFLRTPAGVRLTAKTIFYLARSGADSAPRVATARPKRIGRGRFKAVATVRLPKAWKGGFRYGSCFRYSEGSGLGDPGASCPKRYRF
jgi:hypothetical protein